MVYVFETLVIIVAVFGGAAALLRALLGGHRLRRKMTAKWEVKTDTITSPSAGGNRVVVSVEKLGHDPIVVESLNPRAGDFEMKLYEAQAEAHNTAIAMNLKGGS